MEEARAKPVCAEEALNLLNCVAQSPYDQDKCVRLLQTLRECVLNKKFHGNNGSVIRICHDEMFLFLIWHLKVKKFSLADQDQQEANSVFKKS
ncbi:hypothetical protein POTOM_012280 [Populus tomentosa]|uniref:Cysteine alpha-hairpin motif superfamily n=1 Tax=Populus tomentosa TaxID=118781 RepID=A0A8X8D9B9_POPTO|nr:hypothetical protein POTOM_012280 [Populus tomentosa]